MTTGSGRGGQYVGGTCEVAASSPVRTRSSGRCLVAWLAAATLGIVGVSASTAIAIPPDVKPPEAVAVLRSGVVWFNNGPILLEGSGGNVSRLGTISASRSPEVAASATAVAIQGGGEGAFVADVPPSPLVKIASPKLLRAGGCKGWLPGSDFVVAQTELVAAGECQWSDQVVREPLYVRGLHGRSRWRVLRWLTVDSQRAEGAIPILTSEGNLVAVGVGSPGQMMRVSILDIPTGRVKSRFAIPYGHLGFASHDRLVLSVPSSSTPGYRLELYSTNGQHLAELGPSEKPPLVSGMHFVTEEEGTLSLRDIAAAQSEQIIGFNEGRELLAFSFRWPSLVISLATRAPLSASDATGCWSPFYGELGTPSLRVLDLTHSRPFDPAPALARPERREPPAGCGPPPP